MSRPTQLPAAAPLCFRFKSRSRSTFCFFSRHLAETVGVSSSGQRARWMWVPPGRERFDLRPEAPGRRDALREGRRAPADHAAHAAALGGADVAQHHQGGGQAGGCHGQPGRCRAPGGPQGAFSSRFRYVFVTFSSWFHDSSSVNDMCGQGQHWIDVTRFAARAREHDELLHDLEVRSLWSFNTVYARRSFGTEHTLVALPTMRISC